MTDRILTTDQMTAYMHQLQNEERSSGTVDKYLRDAQAFWHWLDGSPVTQELLTGWKEHLLRQSYVSTTSSAEMTAERDSSRCSGVCFGKPRAS